MKLSTALILISSTFLINACAHRPKLIEMSQAAPTTSSRFPASTGDSATDNAIGMPDENYEADLQTVLQSQTAASTLLDKVNRLVRLHQRAQQDLTTFDDDLDDAIANKSRKTPVTDRTNKIYSRLVTLMTLTHVQRDKISYMYARLLDISADGTEAEKAVASQLIGELRHKARTLSNSERVFLQDLLRDLGGIQRQFEKTAAKAPPETSFDLALFATPEDLTHYYDEHHDDIDEDITDAVSIPDPQLEAMSASVHQMLNSSGLRSPQNSGIQPSTGTNGNMTGREFPAGTWAFTFDDGPSAEYTPGILNNLDTNGIKGTFFWLAQNTKRPTTQVDIARALNSGMQPQCHSYTHANLAHASQTLINKEVVQAVAEERNEYSAIKKDYDIKFYRCPYGSCLHNQQIRQELVNLKLIHAFWDVDTLDWQDHNPASIVARAQKQMAVQKRGIILFHDIHPQSVVASGLLMKAVKADKTLRTVTLPQMIDELNH